MDRPPVELQRLANTLKNHSICGNAEKAIENLVHPEIERPKRRHLSWGTWLRVGVGLALLYLFCHKPPLLTFDSEDGSLCQPYLATFYYYQVLLAIYFLPTGLLSVWWFTSPVNWKLVLVIAVGLFQLCFGVACVGALIVHAYERLTEPVPYNHFVLDGNEIRPYEAPSKRVLYAKLMVSFGPLGACLAWCLFICLWWCVWWVCCVLSACGVWLLSSPAKAPLGTLIL